MARKKKRQWVKKLRQIHPSQFFVKKGRLQRGRVILVVALVGGLALWQTDIQHQRVEATTPVSELPLNELTHEQFIARLAPEAQSLQAQYGVKASISIAQAALESDWGRSELAAKYNNFFGVKASAGMPSVTRVTLGMPAEAFTPKKLLYFAASSERPQSDSKAACAILIDAFTPYCACKLCASGAKRAINCSCVSSLSGNSLTGVVASTR